MSQKKETIKQRLSFEDFVEENLDKTYVTGFTMFVRINYPGVKYMLKEDWETALHEYQTRKINC